MADVQELIRKYDGCVFGITGPDQGQCTAVAHAWESMLGLPIVYGNAKDTFKEAPDELYHKELNTPEGVPSPGAIMVWDERWGSGYGHTAVVVSANVNTFDCLEQNDGEGGVTHIGRHNYGDTIGWFTPRVLDAPLPEPEPTPEPTPAPTPEPVPSPPIEAPVEPVEMPSLPFPVSPEPGTVVLPDNSPDTPVVVNEVNAPKPGIKTTEFWMASLLLVLPIINQILGTNLDVSGTTMFVTTLTSAIAALMGAVSYITGRMKLKGA
jgi:surface antigen